MKKLILAFTLSATAAFATTTLSPFELPWVNSSTHGTTFKSSDHPNGIFVLEAYFNGCPYCNDNAQNVDDLATKFASDPRVLVLDVSIDRSASDYQEWISNHHPNHPVLNDGKRKVTGQLGTSEYPSTYVVDCKGNVVAETNGEWGADEQRTIENAVTQLQGQQCNSGQ